MKSKFLGTGVALVTPFKSDLSVDYEALANIVNFNIENGTEYLVICGTTGESVTISKQEKKDVTETISKANDGRVPLVLDSREPSSEALSTIIIEKSLQVCPLNPSMHF